VPWDNSNAVHIFSEYGALYRDSSLIKLMDGIVQTINGSFAAYHLGGTSPGWRSVPSTAVSSSRNRDDGILPLLKARFRKDPGSALRYLAQVEEDKARTPTGSLVLPEQWSRAAQAPMANALPAIETALRTIMREGKIISIITRIAIVDGGKELFHPAVLLKSWVKIGGTGNTA